ncbi:4'-phosphopantetheinyl transferase superfamily protein [Streptomyces sp. AJS327]|nr:4'-phosphopantetheinyl transferase superfamily protein [Streptomyces sp. AJS327]
MVHAVLPELVAAADAFEEADESVLFPEELETISAAWEKRRREYTTVRACARQALAQLGQPPVPLLSGKRNVPLWPTGVVGSMTHCDGYRAAAVAPAEAVRAMGIDAEPNLPLPEGVRESIALPREIAWIQAGERAADVVQRGRLLFSAKESVYKTWYPLMGTELDFADADITFTETARHTATDPAGGVDVTGRFTARLLRTPRPERPRPEQHPVPTTLTGHWVLGHGFLLTAITLPPQPTP